MKILFCNHRILFTFECHNGNTDFIFPWVISRVRFGRLSDTLPQWNIVCSEYEYYKKFKTTTLAKLAHFFLQSCLAIQPPAGWSGFTSFFVLDGGMWAWSVIVWSSYRGFWVFCQPLYGSLLTFIFDADVRCQMSDGV